MTATAAHFSAAEFVKGLTDEQKEDVFNALFAEVLASDPGSTVIPVHPEGGELLGHVLTLRGAKRLLESDGWKYLPEILIPVVHSREPGLTLEEVWERIDAAEAERAGQSRSRAAG